MRCAWNEFMALLPKWRKSEADKYHDTLQELRLRVGLGAEYVTQGGVFFDNNTVREDELRLIINAASMYSPWTAESAARGYITASGGHRIGLCGEAVTSGKSVTAIKNLTSLNIRIARDYPGTADCLPTDGNILILGPPGCGKTTLMRDLIRKISCKHATAVVDERGELFPSGFDRGLRTDILTNCPKETGMDMLLRTMGPEWIAMDEITSEQDCDALARAAWCGVKFVATAHAASLQDLQRRMVYRPLWEKGLFEIFVLMGKDKQFTVERMGI